MARKTRSAWVLALLTCMSLRSIAAPTPPMDAATIADLNAALKSGALTSEQLVTLCLACVEAYDEHGPKISPR